MPRSEQSGDATDGSGRRPRRRVVLFLLPPAVVLLALVIIVAGSLWPTPAPPSRPKPVVFAHYFPPYPISLDNRPAAEDYYHRNYLTPGGESGKHEGYGGLLRDRPIPVAPGGQDWRIRNLRSEIRQAQAAGIDGFVVDLLSADGSNWQTTVDLMRAADELDNGFVVVPMVDATASFGRLDPVTAAARIATLLQHRSAYRTDRGYLLSSFAAERRPTLWWQSVITVLQTRHRLPISFQAVFLNPGPANMLAFSSIADGYGSWGTRTVRAVRDESDLADRAHRMGKTWMAPVAVQDYRPRSASYAEASNTELLRTMWRDAIDDGADSVQLVTWNDYSESTQFAPSVAHGSCFGDLSRYYADWFTDRSRPEPTTDAIYLTHRTQRADAAPYLEQQPATPDLGGASTEPRDRVEVLTQLTRPSTVRVTVGGRTHSYRAPAGVSARLLPLRTGTVSAELVTPGRPTLTTTSAHPVVDRPYVQDLQYYASCARR